MLIAVLLVIAHILVVVSMLGTVGWIWAIGYRLHQQEKEELWTDTGE